MGGGVGIWLTQCLRENYDKCLKCLEAECRAKFECSHFNSICHLQQSRYIDYGDPFKIIN